MSTIEIVVDIICETSQALLVSDGDIEVWLPQSQIEHCTDTCDGKGVELSIPEWLAIEKGLV